MSRSKVVAINLICWALGVLFVIGGGWVLDQLLAEGALKTVAWWLLVGLAVTLFGGVPRIVTRRQDDESAQR